MGYKLAGWSRGISRGRRGHLGKLSKGCAVARQGSGRECKKFENAPSGACLGPLMIGEDRDSFF